MEAITGPIDSFLPFVSRYLPGGSSLGLLGRPCISNDYWNRPLKETWVSAEDGACRAAWLATLYVFNYENIFSRLTNKRRPGSNRRQMCKVGLDRINGRLIEGIR